MPPTIPTLVLSPKADRNGTPKRLDVVRALDATDLGEAVADLPAGDYKVMHGTSVYDATVGYETRQINSFR